MKNNLTKLLVASSILLLAVGTANAVSPNHGGDTLNVSLLTNSDYQDHTFYVRQTCWQGCSNQNIMDTGCSYTTHNNSDNFRLNLGANNLATITMDRCKKDPSPAAAGRGILTSYEVLEVTPEKHISYGTLPQITDNDCGGHTGYCPVNTKAIGISTNEKNWIITDHY